MFFSGSISHMLLMCSVQQHAEHTSLKLQAESAVLQCSHKDCKLKKHSAA
jgi:hypothetical protein